MEARTSKRAKEILCGEIEEVMRKIEKEGFNREKLDILHELTDTLKNLYKIEMYEQAEHGYSGDGMYRDRRYSHDSMHHGGSYDDEHSERMHYVRGHYSHDDGRKDMMNKLDDLMHDAPTEKDREAIRRCMSLMRDM